MVWLSVVYSDGSKEDWSIRAVTSHIPHNPAAYLSAKPARYFPRLV